MKYLTEIEAINPETDELVLWAGPDIEACSEEEAKEYCQKNGLGYCKIIGHLAFEMNPN